MPISHKLKNEIESFVDEYVLKYPVPKVRSDKVIHDTLWGTQLLAKHEIAIIDTPLIQRLRQIRQTAFAYLTYPSSLHSRFEHTIGVMSQCTRLGNALHSKYREKVTPETIANVRLSALLHDCGHGPFSHTSEEIYRFLPEMRELTKPGASFEHKNPHEILSYLIVSSAPFKKYLQKLERDYGDLKINHDIVASSIIKKKRASSVRRYEQEIINGPFDADKLDYIFRDSHFSGIKLSVDLDRLWYTANIDYIKKEKCECLTIDYSGAITLEQILFCKMMLYATIYHHPKVRACDCMLKGIIEYCQNNGLKIAGKDLSEVISYLYLTDKTIFSEAEKTKSKPLHNLIHNLLYRRLLKRALVISMKTLGEKDNAIKLFQLSNPTIDNYHRLRELAKAIWLDAGKPCLLEEVWIDLPKLPHNKETHTTFIKTPDSTFIPLNDNFPIDEWVSQYGKNKWRGHVFCPPDDKIREKISKSSRKVLQEALGIKLNDLALKLTKIPHSSDITTL